MTLVAILALILPGYMLVKALGLPMGWAAAFPLSALLLTLTVIGFTLVGIPIRFDLVLASLTMIAAASAMIWRRRDVGAHVDPRDQPAPVAWTVLTVTVAASVLLVLLGVLVRTSLYPMSGYDTIFRWDALARLMLEHQNLSYYPPITADDFTKYTYPDGIPPLTSTVYWFLYAAWGQPWPALSAIPVVLQVASCLALVFHAARGLFGLTGGLLALAALATSGLWIQSVAIGQETGYTALSIAGQLAFALLALRNPKANAIVVAGLFAGLGGVAREYGPVLSLCGIIVLVARAETRRGIALFCLVAALVAAPWFIRNWIRTGNPVYSIDVGGLFFVNPVHAGIMAKYREYLALGNRTLSDWWQTLLVLLWGAPLALFLGLPGLVLSGKRGIGLGLTAAVVALLWLWSISSTNGGIVFSMRVLSPCWVALAVAAGAFGPLVDRWAVARRGVAFGGAAAVCALFGAYATLCAWAHPLPAAKVAEGAFSVRHDPLEMSTDPLTLGIQNKQFTIAPTTILTDNCYLAVALQRRTTLRPAMIWSPAVACIFDRELGAKEVRRRLIEQGVNLIYIDPALQLNALYLQQFPFYHQELSGFKPVLEGDEGRCFFQLMPVDPK